MKLDSNSHIALQTLVGALLINPNGAEFFITGFHVTIGDLTEIMVGIEDAARVEGPSSIKWSSLKDWQIQLQEEN